MGLHTPPRELVDSIVQSLRDRPQEWSDDFSHHRASRVRIHSPDDSGFMSISIRSAEGFNLAEYGGALFFISVLVPWRWRIYRAVRRARAVKKSEWRASFPAAAARATRILLGASEEGESRWSGCFLWSGTRAV